jgi:autotransporter-associated beta strand protein
MRAACLLLLISALPALAQSFTWNNSTGNWSTATNWGGAAPVGANTAELLNFGGSVAYTTTNDLNSWPATYLNSLSFTNTAAVTLAGTGSFPTQPNLQLFGVSGPQVALGGSGAVNLTTPFFLANTSLLINATATTGTLTLGTVGDVLDSPFNGRGTVSLINQSPNSLQLGNLGERFAGTLTIGGGAAAPPPFTVTAAGSTASNVLGERTLLNVNLGSSFTLGGNGEFFGGVTGGGVVAGGNFGFLAPQNLTFDGVFAGGASGAAMVKDGRSGASTYTWTGGSSYNGGVLINAGTIQLSGTGTMTNLTALLINNGSTLHLDSTTTANNNRIDLVTGTPNLQRPFALNGTLRLSGSGVSETLPALNIGGINVPFLGTVNSNGAAVIDVPNATATLTLAELRRFGVGSWVSFTGAGTVNVTIAPTLTNGILGFGNVGDEWATVSGGAIAALPAGSYTTTNNPATWTATDNVKLTAAPTGAVPANATVNSLNWATSATLNLAGATIVTSGGLLVATTATTASLTGGSLRANQQFQFASPEVVTVVNNPNATLTINSVIEDHPSAAFPTTSFLKIGPGTVVLTGTNTYTNGTRVYGGTLRVSNDANLGGTTAAGELQLSNATLDIVGGAFTTDRVVRIGGTTSAISVATGQTATFTNRITGMQNASPVDATQIIQGAAWTKTGAGTLLVSGANARLATNGLVSISAGTLRTDAGAINVLASLPAGSGSVENLAVVDVAGGATFDLSFTAVSPSLGGISGGGTVRARAGQTLTFTTTADLTFSGSLQAGTDGTPSAGAVLTLIKNGPGYLTLTGASTFGGPVELRDGALFVGANVPLNAPSPLGQANTPIALGSPTGNLAAGLFINTAGVTVARPITVTAGGTGVLQLGSTHATGTSTFSGPLTLNRAVELNTSTGTTTFTGAISGTGGLAKTGPGTAILANATGNTLSGPTAVVQGTLEVSNTSGSATGTGSVTVGSGATLGGTGRLAGTGVRILGNGAVRPGSGTTLGALTINSTGSPTRFDAGSTLSVVVNSTVTSATPAALQQTANTVDLAGLGTGSNRLQIVVTSETGALAVVPGTPYTYNLITTASPSAQLGGGLVTANYNVVFVGFSVSTFALTSPDANTLRLSFTPVPEPLLGGAGLALVGWWGCRRGRRVQTTSTNTPS